MHLPKLGRILAAEGDLQPLLAKARELNALAGLIDGFLPPDLARQSRVANLREGAVVLLAANSAAAAKLKLLAPSLARFLAERRWQVNSVSVRVQPNRSQERDVAQQKTARLSAQNLDDLRALHDRLSPSAAREALSRLLERHGALASKARAADAPLRKGAGSRRRQKAPP